MGSIERRRRAVERLSDVSGTTLMAVGSGLAAAAGSSALNTLVTSDHDGRWWFVALFLVALLLLWVGVWLARRLRRYTVIGILATAEDPRLNPEDLRRQVSDAARYARRSFASCVAIPETRLPIDYVDAAATADLWGRQMLAVVRTAEAVAPSAARVNLLVICPLHVAFRVGAQLGTAGRRIVVHAERSGDGAADYFQAVPLRQAGAPRCRPVDVGTLEQVGRGSGSRVALALDLGGKGEAFFGPVLAACREHRIGWVLKVVNPAIRLAEDEDTFTGVVDTVAEAWRTQTLPTAPPAERFVFMNGPPSLAVGLGAVLSKLGDWTPMAYERTGGGRYVPFEPAGE